MPLAAVERGVEVRLLMSQWAHTRPSMWRYLASLQDLTGVHRGAKITVRRFTVPSFDPSQAGIPFARVNHNKYMVTDGAAYIGTSNWSADYFINTGGIGAVVVGGGGGGSNDTLRRQVVEIFTRDWESSYSSPL